MCYVIGCDEPVVLCAIHKFFGRVLSCAGHHPERSAYARGFGRPAEASALPHPDVRRGPSQQRVPVLPQPFSRPPSGAAAVLGS